MLGFNKQKGETFAEGPQSWRELAGPRRSRVNSSRARKRRQMRWGKLVLGILLCGLVIFSFVKLGHLIKHLSESKVTRSAANPVSIVEFQTDGVLSGDWLKTAIHSPQGLSMICLLYTSPSPRDA